MRIFLSHTWADKAIVMQLAHSLNDLGPSVEVWQDCEQLPLGGSIGRGVEAAIDESAVVAVLWSAAAARSDGVAHELGFAHRSGVRIVPIVVEGAEPAAPPLPTEVDRDALSIRLANDPSGEEIDLAAARLLEIVVRDLAADPEVNLPGIPNAMRSMQGFGAVLQNIVGKTSNPEVRKMASQWARAFSQSKDSMEASMGPQLADLKSSMKLLEAVLAETKRRPTDADELRRLRGAAEDFYSSDPEAAAQAIKVIDMRLADPLR